MISDRMLADAILARAPDGVTGFEIARRKCKHLGEYWCVTMHEGEACVSETDTALSSALAKANVSLLRQREQRARQASMAVVFTPKSVVTA